MENPFLTIDRRLENIEELLLEIKHRPQTPQVKEAPEPDAAQLLTKKEAARLIGVSPGTIDNAARAGKLQRRYIGKAVRFLRSEVLSLPEGKAQRTPGAPLLKREKRKA